MDDQKPGKKTEEKVTEETRYKYIGFDVYPKKPKKFWKSEEEKTKLLILMFQGQSTVLLKEVFQNHQILHIF